MTKTAAMRIVYCLPVVFILFMANLFFIHRCVFNGMPMNVRHKLKSPDSIETLGSNLRYTLMMNSEFHETKGILKSEETFHPPVESLVAVGFPLDLNGVGSLNESSFDYFVVVTAASANHFLEAMDAIARVQLLFPNRTIFFYDLDLSPLNITVKKLGMLCNVVYRKFNYSSYPSHVQQLLTYAFKPIIIHEVLREYKTLLWIDSSIRLKNASLDVIRRQAAHESRGIILFDYTGYSIFSMTHGNMYKYLAISKSAAVNVSMRGAGAVYIHCSRQLYDDVIRWWVLCALEVKCISPTRRLFCRSYEGRDSYRECHRFDQSALNILLSNYFNYDSSKYSAKDDVLDVRRRSVNAERLHLCQALNRTALGTVKPVDFFHA